MSGSTVAPAAGRVSRFVESSLGAKLVLAATGLVLYGFLVGHMLGNLQVFAGQAKLNAYGVMLRTFPVGLFLARAALLAALVLHVVLAIRVTLQNRAARPQRYQVAAQKAAGLASRSMILTGAAILLFVVYHLLHFTWTAVHPEFAGKVDAEGRADIYSMVVGSFQEPLIALTYVLAMLLLFPHLAHGLSSLFQTFGWRKDGRIVDKVGPLCALIVVAGNISIPAAVLLGLVKLP